MKTLTLLLSLFVVCFPLAAQPTVLQSGARVRVTAADRFLVGAVGRVVTATSDSLFVGFDRVVCKNEQDFEGWCCEKCPPRRDVLVGLAHSDIDELEVSTDRKTSGGKGFLLGVAVGVGTGGLLGLASGDDPATAVWRWTAEQKAGAFAALLGLAGGIAGLIIGSQIETDVWEPLPPGSPMQVVSVIGPHSVGLTFRVRLR